MCKRMPTRGLRACSSHVSAKRGPACPLPAGCGSSLEACPHHVAAAAVTSVGTEVISLAGLVGLRLYYEFVCVCVIVCVGGKCRLAYDARSAHSCGLAAGARSHPRGPPRPQIAERERDVSPREAETGCSACFPRAESAKGWNSVLAERPARHVRVPGHAYDVGE